MISNTLKQNKIRPHYNFFNKDNDLVDPQNINEISGLITVFQQKVMT